MNILKRIAAAFRAASDPSFNDPRFWPADAPTTYDSFVASNSIALKVSAWWSCVKVLSEAMASLPVKVYRTSANGDREEVFDSSVGRRFNRTPNAWQSPYEFREWGMMALLAGGNAFWSIRNGSEGFASALTPIAPDTVKVEQIKETGRLRFVVTPRDGSGPATLAQEQVFRIAGLSSNGITGLSVVENAAHSLGLAVHASTYGNRLFANNASPMGVLEHPGVLGDDGRLALRDGWEKVHRGPANAGKIGILEEGMKYHAVGMSPKDAQFIELREFTVGDICRWFRVPPHMVFDLRRATFSNIEQQNLEFVQFTLLPWIRRWETAIARDLLDEAEAETLSVEFKVDGLLRGDTKSRFNAYGIAIEKGWMSRNEVRGLESLNRAEGLDDYLYPSNLAVVGKEPVPIPGAAPPGGPPVPPEDDDEEDDEGARAANVAITAPIHVTMPKQDPPVVNVYVPGPVASDLSPEPAKPTTVTKTLVRDKAGAIVSVVEKTTTDEPAVVKED